MKSAKFISDRWISGLQLDYGVMCYRQGIALPSACVEYFKKKGEFLSKETWHTVHERWERKVAAHNGMGDVFS